MTRLSLRPHTRTYFLGTCLCVFAVTLLTGLVQAQVMIAPDTAGVALVPLYRDFTEPIDPEVFLVRPGERLRVTFVGSKIPGFTLVVDPEGYVTDASLGRVALSGKSLAEVRGLLTRLVRKSFTAPEIHISIESARLLALKISGHVAHPGTYLLYTSQRASEAIALAGGITSAGSGRLGSLLGGPKELRVDIDRAVMQSESSFDPPLYAGTHLHVPPRSAREIHVVGAVITQRVVEWVDGDDVATWIALAGGAAPDGNPAAARFLYLDSADGAGVLFVPQKQEAYANAVSIHGGIAKPGRYEMSESASLTDLIKLAGPFEASEPERVVIFRRAGADLWGNPEKLRYPIVLATDALHSESAQLQAGDSILVPRPTGMVRISGQVNRAGAFPFTRGKSVSWYLNAAGGVVSGTGRPIIRLLDPIAGTASEANDKTVPYDGAEIVVVFLEETR